MFTANDTAPCYINMLYKHYVKFIKCVVAICTGVSKYLRHSAAVSSKHYDFGVIEESVRNTAAVLKLIARDDQPAPGVVELDTDTNSTIIQVGQLSTCSANPLAPCSLLINLPNQSVHRHTDLTHQLKIF